MSWCHRLCDCSSSSHSLCNSIRFFFFCMFPIAHCAHPKQTSVCSWHWLSTYSPPQLHCWFLLPSSMGNCSGYVAVAEGGYEFSEEESQTLKTVKRCPPEHVHRQLRTHFSLGWIPHPHLVTTLNYVSCNFARAEKGSRSKDLVYVLPTSGGGGGVTCFSGVLYWFWFPSPNLTGLTRNDRKWAPGLLF